MRFQSCRPIRYLPVHSTATVSGRRPSAITAVSFTSIYGDPDYGIYITKTKDPAGEWEPLVLVKPDKGLIDPCALWDETVRLISFMR